MQVTTALTSLMVILSIFSGYVGYRNLLKTLALPIFFITFDSIWANLAGTSSVFLFLFEDVFYVEDGAQAGLMSINSALSLSYAELLVCYLFFSNHFFRIRAGYILPLTSLIFVAVLIISKIFLRDPQSIFLWNNTGISIPTLWTLFAILLSILLWEFSQNPIIRHKKIALFCVIFSLLSALSPLRLELLIVTGSDVYGFQEGSSNAMQSLRYDTAILYLSVVCLLVGFALIVGDDIKKALLAKKLEAEIRIQNELLVSATINDIIEPLYEISRLTELINEYIEQEQFDRALATGKAIRSLAKLAEVSSEQLGPQILSKK